MKHKKTHHPVPGIDILLDNIPGFEEELLVGERRSVVNLTSLSNVTKLFWRNL
jgi:hypothetical protein